MEAAPLKLVLNNPMDTPKYGRPLLSGSAHQTPLFSKPKSNIFYLPVGILDLQQPKILNSFLNWKPIIRQQSSQDGDNFSLCSSTSTVTRRKSLVRRATHRVSKRVKAKFSAKAPADGFIQTHSYPDEVPLGCPETAIDGGAPSVPLPNASAATNQLFNSVDNILPEDRFVLLANEITVETQIHQANIADASPSIITTTIEKVKDFFGMVKPCTMLLTIKRLIRGNLLERGLAVSSLIEQIGLSAPAALTTLLVHITEFFVFIYQLVKTGINKIVRQQSSFRENLEELFGTDLPDCTEVGLKILSAVVGFVGLLTGGLATFCNMAANKQSFANLLKSVGEMAKNVTAIGGTSKYFIEITKQVLSFCGFQIDADSQVSLRSREFEDFVTDFERFVAAIRQHPASIYEGTPFRNRCALARAYERWYLEISRGGENREIYPIYQRCITARHSMEQYGEIIENGTGIKEEPTCLYFFGPAGAGKSQATHEIIKYLQEETGEYIRTYCRNIQDAYWSGYTQQKAVVIDDFAMDSTDKKDMQELMCIYSCAEYRPPQAHLADKGVPYTSPYLFLNSNYDSTRAEGYDFDAADRRRDFFYYVSNPTLEQWIANGPDDLPRRIADFPDHNMNQLVFTPCSYTQEGLPQIVYDRTNEQRGEAGLRKIATDMAARRIVKRRRFTEAITRQTEAMQHFGPEMTRRAEEALDRADFEFVEPNIPLPDDPSAHYQDTPPPPFFANVETSFARVAAQAEDLRLETVQTASNLSTSVSVRLDSFKASVSEALDTAGTHLEDGFVTVVAGAVNGVRAAYRAVDDAHTDVLIAAAEVVEHHFPTPPEHVGLRTRVQEQLRERRNPRFLGAVPLETNWQRFANFARGNDFFRKFEAAVDPPSYEERAALEIQREVEDDPTTDADILLLFPGSVANEPEDYNPGQMSMVSDNARARFERANILIPRLNNPISGAPLLGPAEDIPVSTDAEFDALDEALVLSEEQAQMKRLCPDPGVLEIALENSRLDQATGGTITQQARDTVNTESLVYCFIGPPGTGKTVLANQIQATAGARVLDEFCGIHDSYTEICQSYDNNVPLVVCTNRYAFERWIATFEEEETARVIRRMRFFKFNFNRRGLRGHYKATDMRNHDPSVVREITDTLTGNRMDNDDVIELFVSDQHRETTVRYLTTILKAPLIANTPLVDLGMISYRTRPSLIQILSAAPPTLIRHGRNILEAGRIVYNTVTNSHFQQTNQSIEAVAKKVTNAMVSVNIPTLRLKFMEGTFILSTYHGKLVVGVETALRVVHRDGTYYWIDSQNRRTPMDDMQSKFYQLVTGTLSAREIHGDVPQTDHVSPKLIKTVDTIFHTIVNLFNTMTFSLNLVDLFIPLEGVINQESWGSDVEEEEPMEYNYVKYLPLLKNKLSKAKFRCNCTPEYACVIHRCGGRGPEVESDARADRKLLHPTQVESMELITAVAAKRKKLTVESGDWKIRLTKLMKLTDVSAQDIIDEAVAYSSDPEEFFKFLQIKEKHHLTGKANVWCWAHVNNPRANGGTQRSHHHCTNCERDVLNLAAGKYLHRKCYVCEGLFTESQVPAWYFHQPCTSCAEVRQQGCVDGQFRQVVDTVLPNIVEFPHCKALMLYGTIGVTSSHCIPGNMAALKNGVFVKVIKRIPKKDLVFFALQKGEPCFRLYKDIRHFLRKTGDATPNNYPAYILMSSEIKRAITMYQIAIKSLTTYNTIDDPTPLTGFISKISGAGQYKTFVSNAGDCGSPVVAIIPGNDRKIVGIHCAGSQLNGYHANVTQEDVPNIPFQQSNLFDLEGAIARNQQLYYGKQINEWCPKRLGNISVNPIDHYCTMCRHYVLEIKLGQGTSTARCMYCEMHVEPPKWFTHKSCARCREDAELKAKATHQVEPISGFIAPTFEIIAVQVDRNANIRKKYTSGKTNLRPSPLETDRYGEPFKLAILAKDDPRNTSGVDPLLKNVDKWNIERPDTDQSEIDLAVDSVSKFYIEVLRRNNKTIKKLTTLESINRWTESGISNPIYMHSSSGFPYATWPEVKFKRPMFKFDGEKYTIDQETHAGLVLQEHVNFLEQHARKGQKTMVIFDINLKDEALPQRKIDAVKTRSIAGSPLDFTIVHRKYFHTLGCAIMETRADHPVKVGIAPNTTEWNDLFHYLTRTGKMGLDADYKHWDASVSKKEIIACGQIYAKIFEALDPDCTPEDSKCRETLYDILSTPNITRDIYVVESTGGGIVSGQPFTWCDNSIVNLMRVFLAYRYCAKKANVAPEEQTFSAFMRHVTTCFGGDDMCAIPDEFAAAFFTYETFKEAVFVLFGVEVTPAAKENEGKPLLPIMEMQFLKRTFSIPEGCEPYVVGGLLDEAFAKMTCKTKVNGSKKYADILEEIEFDEDNVVATVDSYLMEASLRGKTFYDWAVNHCRGACAVWEIPFQEPPNWHDRFVSLYFNQTRVIYDYL